MLLAGLLASCRERPGAPAAASEASRAPQASSASRGVALAQLCPTLGTLERLEPSRFYHPGPKLRATAADSTGDFAALTFRYLGPSPQPVALASGERRAQIGLKLGARDSCNVGYVMWRLSPPVGVVASWKSNPGTRHAQCGNRGYRKLRSVWSAPVELPKVGSEHELSARIEGGLVHAWIDGRPVLRAALEPGMSAGSGEAGLRSDNLRFELLGFAAVSAGPGRAAPGQRPCAPTGAD